MEPSWLSSPCSSHSPVSLRQENVGFGFLALWTCGFFPFRFRHTYNSCLLSLFFIHKSSDCVFFHVLLSDPVSPEAESAAVPSSTSSTTDPQGEELHQLHCSIPSSSLCLYVVSWTSTCFHCRSAEEGFHEGGRCRKLLQQTQPTGSEVPGWD